MKSQPPERFRITAELARRMGLPPHLGSDQSFGQSGLFYVPCGREVLRCIACDQEGWEHVSVSLPRRTPTWEEMCFIKDLFWEADECVVQFHPAKSEYVNHHPYCLHLWRSLGAALPTPPAEFVGPRR